MTTNDDQYVPHEFYVREAWVDRHGTGNPLFVDEAEAEFDRFLARVRRDAWAEGCRAAEQYYRRTVVGIPGLDPIPAPVNPHEETP